MRKSKEKVVYGGVAFCMAVMLLTEVAGGVYAGTTMAQASTVRLNKSSASIYLRKTTQLKVLNTTKKVTWTTGKASVATVSSAGKVTGKGVGTASITATVSGKKYTCKIAVKKKYKNGTYTGSGTGYHGGTTKVSVTIKSDKITAVKVTSNQDTPRYFSYASPTIISRIISANSSNVDAVSGATYSSNGIKDAVASALKKAQN